MEQVDETTISDEELLNHNLKKSTKNIISHLKKVEKNQAECLLCISEFRLNNVHDLVRIYSLCLYCLTNHCKDSTFLRKKHKSESNVELSETKVRSSSVNIIKDMFSIEMFILKFMLTFEYSDIKNIVLYTNKNENLYKNELKKQLLALYTTHYYDSSLNINCEQEIESLTFKYYQKSALCDDMFSTKLVLILLYSRKEYLRFINILRNSKKDIFMCKLGLLTIIKDENNEELEYMLKCFIQAKITYEYVPMIKKIDSKYVYESLIINEKLNSSHMMRIQEDRVVDGCCTCLQCKTEMQEKELILDVEIKKNSTLNNIDYERIKENGANIKDINSKYLTKEDIEHTKYLKKPLDKFELFIKDLNLRFNLEMENLFFIFKGTSCISEWIDEQKIKIYWKECVNLWSKNREDNERNVDNSMIDLCIKFKKFEEGWIIFKSLNRCTTSGMNRGINLCITALKKTRHPKWLKRTSFVINTFFDNISNINMLVVLDNLMYKLNGLSVQSLLTCIIELNIVLVLLDLNEQCLDCLLKGYYYLCLNYKNQELNKICCQHAISVYKNWISKRKKNFIFFKKKTMLDTNIYSSMLGICDISKNCDFFYKVCRDILNNEAYINRELCRRLENFHFNNCKNCEHKKKQIVTVSESKGFISHLFK